MIGSGRRPGGGAVIIAPTNVARSPSRGALSVARIIGSDTVVEGGSPGSATPLSFPFVPQGGVVRRGAGSDRATSTTSAMTDDGYWRRNQFHGPKEQRTWNLADPDRFQRQFMEDNNPYSTFTEDFEDDRASRLSCLSTKYDRLHSIRYKLEHNHISRANLEAKVAIFQTLRSHCESDDPDVKLATIQVIRDILPHLGPDIDLCMSSVLPLIVPCLASDRMPVQKATLSLLQINLKFCCDIQAVLRVIVHQGLDNSDPKVVHATLVCLPILFPQDYDLRYGNKNLFLIVSGIARRLVNPEFQAQAFMSLDRIGEVLGPRQFHTYIDKFTLEQKKAFDELNQARHASQPPTEPTQTIPNSMGNGVAVIPANGVVGRRVSGQKGWVEYGSIDDSIIEKLKDDEDIRVRLQGAEELNRAFRGMKDMTPLLPQLRLFLNFLDSLLEEQNFKMNLLTLDIYGVLIDRIKAKIKPHLRTVCGSLLKHCSHSKIVVRIENYRVVKRLMMVAKPNPVLNHMFDHIGDKRAVVREAILNIVMFALLTFPSYEFDLKNIAASIVPTLVDPKRRVRQASQECIAILAAFMGPSKATPLIRSIELLENHFEKGTGVLSAIQSRLSRRQLPRVTPDGLVEYSLHIPSSALRGEVVTGSYGPDIDWILAGTGSISSGSAKSVSTQSDPRLDESLSSSASFPNSPVSRNGGFRTSINGTALQPIVSSRSEESLNIKSQSPTRNQSQHFPAAIQAEKRRRSRTDSDLKSSEEYVHLPEHVRGSLGRSSREEPRRPSQHTTDSELPRLTGTKSQASTASSSATRDSGISLSEQQARQQQMELSRGLSSRTSSRAKSRYRQQISVDDLPVNGHALNLANRRPSTNKSSVSSEDQQRTLSRLSTKYNGASQSQDRLNHVSRYMADDEDLTPPGSQSPMIQQLKASRSENHLNSITPPRSPKFPNKKANPHPLLMRPADNSPFSSRMLSKRTGSQISTPYSQVSVPSSYEYEDDFTSDESIIENNSVIDNQVMNNNRSAASNRTMTSTASSGSMSRIPIKRNSSLRRKKDIMNNYNKPLNGEIGSLALGDAPMSIEMTLPPNKAALLPMDSTSTPQGYSPLSSVSTAGKRSTTRFQPSRKAKRSETSTATDSSSTSIPKVSTASVRTIKSRATRPFRLAPRSDLKTATNINGHHSKSLGSGLNHMEDTGEDLDMDVEDDSVAFKRSNRIPNTPPGHEPNPLGMPETPKDMDIPRTPVKINPEDGLAIPPPTAEDHLPLPDRSLLSTAQSTISNSNYQHLQLKTAVTLKSPFEGANLGPAPISPAEFVTKSTEQMESSDWEINVKGIMGIVRVAKHHPDYLIPGCKEILTLIMKHVKNLRSQVCRAATMTLVEMIVALKKNIESELDKVTVPLIHKTADTNKFLREDGHVALDAIVENMPPQRVLAVITADSVLNHKNPVIRGTVARMLAYITDRVGVQRALGTKELIEKLVPSIAKLAQDGAQEARNFAKLTLVMFMDQHPDYEKILKKNVTPNTMRNLEKIMDALKQNQNGPNGNGRSGNARLSQRRRAKSRQTL